MVISWLTFKNDGLSITSFWDECACACLCACARPHVYHPLFKTSRQLWLLIHILGDKMWSLSDSAIGQRNLWPHRVYLSGRSFVFPRLAFPGCTSQPWTQLCLRAWSTLCHMRLPAGVKRPPVWTGFRSHVWVFTLRAAWMCIVLFFTHFLLFTLRVLKEDLLFFII